MLFASIAEKWKKTTVFVLNDNDEAGYFYNDLKTIAMPDDNKDKVAEVLFFPSSYRRAVKYGQRDAGNEILRTEVLTRFSPNNGKRRLFHSPTLYCYRTICPLRDGSFQKTIRRETPDTDC